MGPRQGQLGSLSSGISDAGAVVGARAAVRGASFAFTLSWMQRQLRLTIRSVVEEDRGEGLTESKNRGLWCGGKT